MEFTNGGKDDKDRDPEVGDEHTDKLQAINSSRSRRSSRSMSRADFRSSSLRGSTGATNFNIFGGGNPLESALGSSHAEDDEQALRWAALEKLPTFNRLRASIFQKHTGSVRQVDVQKDLSTADFHHLLDKLHRKAADEDEQLFVKMRQRLDRVGIELPSVEVRYENFTVKANCHVGNRGLPTLLNVLRNIGEVNCSPTHIQFSS